MRTAAEIVERIREKRQEIFNFEPEVLVHFLTWDEAKPLFEADAMEDWLQPEPLTRERVLSIAETYMREYGWPKALGHRGISACRTVDKMTAWCWLLGDDEAVAYCDEGDHYPCYGAPILRWLCQRFGWPIPDDSAARNMADGLDCTGRGACREGCIPETDPEE